LLIITFLVGLKNKKPDNENYMKQQALIKHREISTFLKSFLTSHFLRHAVSNVTTKNQAFVKSLIL